MYLHQIMRRTSIPYKPLVIFPLLLLFLGACRRSDLAAITPSETNVPTVTPIVVTPTLTATPSPAYLTPVTPTGSPTWTPIPVTAPYEQVPEQIDDGWLPASLVDVGIDPVWINKMLGAIDPGNRRGIRPSEQNEAYSFHDIHSILIVKDGRLVFEEYFYNYYRENPHTLASVTKSITSLLVGLAIDQGHLSGVDEKILPYFPEYLPLQQPDQRVGEITIEDLLTMRHGWECDEWDPASITYRTKDFEYKHADLVKATLELPVETDPGSHFSYCTPSTVVLGAVLERATGMTLSQFAWQNLFDPLGINRATWMHVPGGGWTQAGSGVEMIPRDMARIGLLVLRNGNWNSEQIVPESWIQRSTEEHVALEQDQPSWDRGYGYLWRLGEYQSRI